MNKLFIVICLFAFSFNYAYAQYIEDTFVDETLKSKKFEKINTNLKYNYENTDRIQIKLTPCQKITTKKDLNDGEILTFKVKYDVRNNRKIIIKKDTLVKARVKTYLTRGWNGIPGQIIIDDFEIEGIDSNKLQTPYLKRGLNLTLMIMPIKWVLTPIPFVGSLANLIVGGHAKLSPSDTVILYYYPNWAV